MGTFSVTMQIGDLLGSSFEEVAALVDTGATTTVIPRAELLSLERYAPGDRPGNPDAARISPAA